MSETIPRTALSRAEAATSIGISDRHLDALLAADPSFPRFQIGKRVLIPIEPLRDWLAAQAKGGGDR